MAGSSLRECHRLRAHCRERSRSPSTSQILCAAAAPLIVFSFAFFFSPAAAAYLLLRPTPPPLAFSLAFLSAEGGSIVMTVDIVEGEADSQRGKSEAFSPSSLRLLRVRVADTGIGLRPEGIARLFQPFSQAEARPRLLAAAARA